MATAGFDPDKCSCPECGAVGRFNEIQPYERYMISVEQQERIDHRLSVRRFLCESCGYTHALLPNVLIPYGSYSLRFILTVLISYLERTCTVAELCEHWCIAVSTLYEWIHLFIDQFNSWCQILDRIIWICRNAIDAVSSVTSFPSAFFSRFAFSFLQGKKTSLSVRPPSVNRQRRPRPT